MKKSDKKKQIRGFTLLEMIVAIGVFATVAVLSISSLLALTNAQKKALALQDIQDNLRFSMESIARDLRQGDFFYCNATNLEDFGSGPPGPGELPANQDCTRGHIVTFLDRENNVVTYRFGTTTYSFINPSSCGINHSCIEKAVRSTGTIDDKYISVPEFFPVTSHDIEINQFDIYVTGSAKNDPIEPRIEPRITIVIDGTAKIGRETSNFNLQTTVSSHRNITRD